MGDLKEKARELLAGRMAALDGIEEAAARAESARVELKAAEGAVTAAWTAATEAGWTPAELRRLGLTQPATRRGGRPKSRKTSTAPPSV